MDPFTIAAGISGIGSLFKGITSLIAGNRQRDADNAAAAQALGEAGVNAQTALQEGDAAAAHGAAVAAANGGGFVGSSIGVIQNLSNQAMFNARAQVYRGQTIAQRDKYEGGVAHAQGVQGFVGSMIDAGTSLVGGMARSAQSAAYIKALGTVRGVGGGYDGSMDGMF